MKRAVFRCAVKLPGGRGFAENEREKSRAELWHKYTSRRPVRRRRTRHYSGMIPL